MLAAKKRVDLGDSAANFLGDAILLRDLKVLPITPEIATLSVEIEVPQGDPADRLIAATAVQQSGVLVTADRQLREASAVTTVW